MPENDKGGDSGQQNEGQGEGAPDSGDQGQQQGDQGGKPNGAPADQDKSGSDSGDGQDWKSRARQHEDRAKANKKVADDALAERDKLAGVLDTLRKALDPNGAGKDADPAELAKQAAAERDQAAADARLARVELAAERAARRAGADVDALLDSRAFLDQLAKLDPTENDFASQVEQAVKDTLKARPSLKAGKPAPPPSSADMSGGGESKPTGRRTIDQIREDRRKRRG